MYFITKKNYKKILINENTKLSAVKRIFNDSGIPICFVLNKKSSIVGSITDGDLRRYKNKKTNKIAKNIMNKNPLIVNKKEDLTSIEKIMFNNAAVYVPVVNNRKKIIGVYSRNAFYSKKKHCNVVVIMAGGLGMRMRPLTINKPKPMLTIAGRPILEHLITNFKSHGFENFIIMTHYKSEMIEHFFQKGNKMKVKINYIREKKLMGTAGGLSLLKNIKNNFFVTNGDIISNINFTELLNFHVKNKSYATMVTKKVLTQNPYGVVKVNGNKIINIIEKPISYVNINTGIYCFNPKVIEFVNKLEFNKLDMNELFLKIKEKNKKVLNYQTNKNWIDLGDKKKFLNI